MIMRIFTLYSLLFLCLNTTAQSSWQMRWSNDAEFRSFTYVSDNDQFKSLNELRGNHSLSLRKGTAIKLLGDINSRYNGDKDRSRIYLNQLYLAYNKSVFNLKLGKQEVKWGNMAGISALDLANVYDYVDFIETDTEELGSWGVSLQVGLKKNKLKLRYFPSTTYSTIYFNNSVWIDIPSEITIEPGDVVMMPVAYSGLEIQENENHTLGLEYGTSLFNTDFKLSLYSGINDIPLVEPQVQLQNLLPLPLLLVAHRHRLDIWALSASKMIGDWTLSGEWSRISNHVLQDGEINSDNYGMMSLGIDRVFFFDNTERIIKMLYQYRRSYGHDYSYSAMDLDHVLDHVSILDAELTLSYNWSYKNTLVVSHRNPAVMWHGSITYKPSDRIFLNLGFQLLSGSEDHFFGLHNNKDRIMSSIKITL